MQGKVSSWNNLAEVSPRSADVKKEMDWGTQITSSRKYVRTSGVKVSLGRMRVRSSKGNGRK